MPVSINGKEYYTDKQYELARYESSALDYVRASGRYQLVKNGSYFHLKEHDSLVFAPNGMWFWNSHDMKGGAIEFHTQYEHKTTVEAVLILAGERGMEETKSETKSTPEEATAKEDKNPDEEKPFELPPKADNFRRLFAYLCGTRGLDREIVKDLIKQGKIYESASEYTKGGETKILNNAVFLGFDKDGQARSGFQRGLVTNTDHPFKRDVAGSEKEYAFCIDGRKDVDTVAVFEASMDAVSHATISKLSGEDYRSMDRIALGGVAFNALRQYLSDHPNIKNVILCVDADQAGDNAAENLKNELSDAGYTQEKGYHCERQIPTSHKDFNEYLISYKEVLEEQKTAAADKEKSGAQEEDGFFPEAEPEGEYEE